MANEETRFKTQLELTRPKVDAGNILSLAVQIYLNQNKNGVRSGDLHSFCQELVKEFKYLEGELK